MTGEAENLPFDAHGASVPARFLDRLDEAERSFAEWLTEQVLQKLREFPVLRVPQEGVKPRRAILTIPLEVGHL